MGRANVVRMNAVGGLPHPDVRAFPRTGDAEIGLCAGIGKAVANLENRGDGGVDQVHVDGLCDAIVES